MHKALVHKVMALAMALLVLSACAPAANSPGVLPFLPPLTLTSIVSQDVPPPCTTIGQEWTSPRDGVTLVCVPAGQFWMGADETYTEAQLETKPRHQVYLDAFWIDRTEATNSAYAQCVAAHGCAPRPAEPGTTGVASRIHLNYYYDSEFADYPVLIYLSDQAATYCKWAGRRLPTEAEWEKAARGTDTRHYPWGAAPLDCAHASYLGCTEDTTRVDVPALGASPYGALNLAGNVWEWVADWYAPDYYSHSPTKKSDGSDERRMASQAGRRMAQSFQQYASDHTRQRQAGTLL